jgi:hypothetical protein
VPSPVIDQLRRRIERLEGPCRRRDVLALLPGDCFPAIVFRSGGR